MKHLTQILQALLGVATLIITTLIAAGRLAWRTIRNWWQKHSKRVKYSLAVLAGLVVAGFAVYIARGVYNNKYGRDFYDSTLSTNIRLHSFADNKWRVYDRRAGEYTTPKINWLKWDDEGEDSLAVYALPNKRGYININTGRIAIDAKANDYQKAWLFSEGVAAVMKEGKIGFINAENEVVIPFQYDYSDNCLMYDFGYIFHNGYCAMTNAEGKLGLIDTTGKWVVEPAYDEIWTPHTSGYRIIINDNRYGVLDSQCNVVYPAKYGYVNVLTDGFLLVNEGKQWQEDFEGNIVRPFIFDFSEYLSYPIGVDANGETQYAYSDFMKYEIMGCYGIMNRLTGRPVTPAIYSEINMLSSMLFEVQEYDQYEWYLLDLDGNVVSGE